MASSAPIELHYLGLHPRPLSKIPHDEETFAAELLAEGTAILDSEAWHSEKLWHENTRAFTTTTTLPDDAWKMRGESSTESKPAAPKKKKGFWSGGGGDAAREDEGIHWHRRVTRLVGDEASYEALWSALGERHCEQELEYVPTLSKVLPVEDNSEFRLSAMGFAVS